MDKAAFVGALRTTVEGSVIAGMLAVLAHPPGRKPDARLLALAAWFNGLPVEDRGNAERLIREAVNAAVFEFLCVLDGVRAIEDRAAKGSLELTYRRGAMAIRLNDDMGEMLHDLFNAGRPPA